MAEAFAAQGADPAFRDAVHARYPNWVPMIAMSAPANTASKAAVKVLVGAENPVTSCNLHILVQEAAEPISA